MAQEYEITDFRKGDFQDQHQNFWCDMVLLGVGEPVRIAVKDPTQYQVGQKLYGRIDEVISKQGKPYKRFFKEERPEQQGFTGSSQSTGKSYDSEGQAWGNAVTNATNLVINTLEPGKNLDDATHLVLATAERLFNGRGNKSGYDQARAKADELRPVAAGATFDDDEPLPTFEGA